MTSSIFNDPDAVERGMNLPAVVSYSFIGEATPAYHARLTAVIEAVAGEGSIRRHRTRPSRGGKFTAYKFDIFHDCFEDVESIYSRVKDLPGTRFVI